MEKVEVTGSSIKRVQEEGAMPIQVITREEILRQGFVSAEDLVMKLSANGTGADNLSSNVGIQLGTTDRNNNGNSSANLRGLGAANTLVLLNGRRVSTHGAKGNAVDLNSIPLSAVERVEVLKDGASAIYGTDAIGGVINFILRRDFKGVEVAGAVDVTEDGGGNVYRATILAGTGDLGKDRYNIMANVAVDRQEILNGHDRSFSNGFQPSRGLSPDTTGTTFATQTGLSGTAMGATFRTPSGGTQTYNRANLLAFTTGCDSYPGQTQYQTVLWNSPGFRYGCAYDYGAAAVMIQPVDRVNLVARGTFMVTNDVTAFAEIVGSRTKATKQFEPLQITTTGSFSGMQYPVNGPYYQDLSAYIATFNPNLPIAYRWRCDDCGGRTIETTTDNYRLLVGLEGVLDGKYDWKLGLSTAGSNADSDLGRGYMFTAPLTTALGSGLVNPWLPYGQSQTPAGQALLDAARADGTKLFGGESRLLQADGAISGDLMKLPAGALSFAAGFDLRRESYKFSDGSTATQPVYQAAFDAEFPKVERTIKAVYGELLVPIVKNLEAQLAVRYDNYSDFGGTTNPKVALKWNALSQLLFRASYQEGFRAPSFFQLYGAQGDAPVPGNVADPVLCPLAPNDLSVCAIRPNARQGGNKDLQPETSKQWSAGFVIEPAKWAMASMDFWEVKRSDRIYELTPQEVLANYTTFPENLVRGTNGRLDGPGGYIRAGFVNADGDIARGFDLTVLFNGNLGPGKWNAGLVGTYYDSFRTRIFDTQSYTELVGQYARRDLYVRWKHTANFTYTQGPWSASLYQQYTDGYKDEVPVGVVPAGFETKVDSYIVYNVSANYTGFRNTVITLGIKNLLNEDPPFTAHNVDFAAGAGWDPRIADPRGRSYTARVAYTF
ncbi:MAG: TonB-dependent receptor [Betaproteobacteria bacterium]|nr:TonB-dependent receptor [Betaproteobacteria bacterium]